MATTPVDTTDALALLALYGIERREVKVETTTDEKQPDKVTVEYKLNIEFNRKLDLAYALATHFNVRVTLTGSRPTSVAVWLGKPELVVSGTNDKNVQDKTKRDLEARYRRAAQEKLTAYINSGKFHNR